MNRDYDMMKYHLDGKNVQIIQINASFYLFYYIHSFSDMVIHNMNNEESLIYWLNDDNIFMTDINISKCNKILYKENISNDTKFQSMTIDKTNIYILADNS